jgi:hypothetical protein
LRSGHTPSVTRAIIKAVPSITVSKRRRPNALPPEEKGTRESQTRFEARMARREQIADAEVTTEVDDQGREWTVRKLADSFG